MLEGFRAAAEALRRQLTYKAGWYGYDLWGRTAPVRCDAVKHVNHPGRVAA